MMGAGADVGCTGTTTGGAAGGGGPGTVTGAGGAGVRRGAGMLRRAVTWAGIGDAGGVAVIAADGGGADGAGEGLPQAANMRLVASTAAAQVPARIAFMPFPFMGPGLDVGD